MLNITWNNFSNFFVKEKSFIISLFIYCLVLFIFQLFRVYAGVSGAWDLGLFSQILWYTLHGKPFYYNVEPWWCNSFSCNFLGVHFCLTLLLFLPFYFLFPSPITVIFIKIFILHFFSLILLYYYCLLRIKNKKISKLIVLLYAFHPGIIGAALFDFHCEDFFPLFLFLLFIALERKRLILFLISYLMIIFSLEHFSIYLPLVISCFILFSNHYKISTKKKLIICFLLIISGILIFLSEIKVMKRFRYKELKSEFITKEIKDIKFSTLFNDFWLKIYYFIELFLPFLFLPLLEPLLLVPVFLWIIFAFISNIPTYYSLETQYSYFIIPVIVLAFIELLSKNKLKFIKIKERVCVLIFVFSLIIASILALFVILHQVPFGMQTLYRILIFHEILSKLNVTRNTSLLLADNFFVFFTNSNKTYAILPVIMGNINSTVNQEKIKWTKILLQNKTYDYIIIDLFRLEKPLRKIVFNNINYSKYSLYILMDHIFVFKKSKKCEPIIFYPIRYDYIPKYLNGMKIDKDNFSILFFTNTCNLYFSAELFRGEYLIVLNLFNNFTKVTEAGKIILYSNESNNIVKNLYCFKKICVSLVPVKNYDEYKICVKVFKRMYVKKISIIYLSPCLEE